MDWDDMPEAVRTPEEDRPDFDSWEPPEAVLKGGSTRERLLDVILQLRTPTKVSTIADSAECDPETAREYLQWFASMGIVCEISGRPVRYERNDSYLRWRRIERIREQYSETEIVEELSAVTEAIEEYREQFDSERPSEVVLVNEDSDESVDGAWEALSDWKTLEQRAMLLDAARQDGWHRR